MAVEFSDDHKLKMNVKAYIPDHKELVKDTLLMLGSIIIAAYIISKFPGIKNLVESNSLTVKNQDGKVLYY